MPLEGFDDASKNISKRGSSRRKASREANSKRIAARQAEKAKKKAAQNEFNKYATPGQKRKAARNSSVNKADVIAKGKATETAKQAKKPATTQESLLNIKNEYVGFNPFKEANKSENITKTVTPKVEKPKAKPKVKALKVVTKKAIEIKTAPTKAPKLANTTLQSSKPKTEEKAYQKKGTMGKGKAPRINVKPKRRAAKGSRAATLKKGFGY